jgi:serine/threonine-protein kinase
MQRVDTLAQTIKDALASRYEIKRPIGRGGMATVYLAEERRPSRKVAVKVLDPDLSDRLGRGRFLREVEIVSNLTHPHIVPVFSAGEVEGLLYYVMPYIEGQSLRQRLLRDGQLPLGDALHIALDVADALEYAHARSVVHRDIKPENILLSSDHALVADFGIARAVSAASEHKLTIAGLPIGTPGYMSPEQATGSAEIDARTDTYSLACVLHETLYGEPPVPGTRDTQAAVRRRRASRKTPSPADTVPETVETAVAKALAWDPGERYRTTAEFARALTGTGETTPHSAHVHTPTPPRQIPPKSIAVLPFASLSSDPDNEYFADGITDEIITHLSKISDLKVTSRTSVMRYKTTDRSLREIGAELGVATVLEGSVRRAGNRVRITAQLVEVDTDAHRWAETYDRDLTDIFEIQGDVASKIASALRATLSPTEQARIEKKPTEHLEAYNIYLRGLYYFNRFTIDSALKALRCFEQAIELDGDFALAYVGLARVYLSAGIGTGPIHPSEAFRSAKEAAERALELDDTLQEPHGVVGAVHTWWTWDWDAAEAAFVRANSCCGECEKAHLDLAFNLAARGRHEDGVLQAKKALELDPVSLITNTHLALQYYWWRRFDRATDQLQRTLDLDARFAPAVSLLGWIRLLTGAPEEAVGAFDRALRHAGQTSALLAALGCGQAGAGRTAEARATLQLLTEPSPEQYVSPRDVALVHSWLGEKEQALEWLERATEERAPWMSFLNVDPVWDTIRSAPRFTALVERILPS